MTHHDAERRELVEKKADSIAKLLGDPNVLTDGKHRVLLTPEQVDSLFEVLSKMGYQNAIDILKAQSESMREENTESGMHMWAVYLAGASFLEAIQ